jgi:hypothetical protein
MQAIVKFPGVESVMLKDCIAVVTPYTQGELELPDGAAYRLPAIRTFQFDGDSVGRDPVPGLVSGSSSGSTIHLGAFLEGQVVPKSRRYSG